MNQFDLDNFRIKEPLYRVPPTKTKSKTKRGSELGEWYIAHIPGPWIAEAAKLPGHALHVALAIMYVRGMERGKEVTLTRYHFDKLGTERGPALRGLKALQKAGLIQYTKRGHQYKVTLLPVGNDSADSTDATTK